MVFYLTLAIVVALFTELSIKTKTRILSFLSFLIAILIPSFFFAVRNGIGTDFYAYLAIFERAKYSTESRIEWGYYTVNSIIAKFGGSLEVVFFIVAIIMFTFVFLALRENRQFISPGLGMLVFMLLFYQMSFNVSRQVVAMTILLFSIKYIESRRLIKFSIFILIASSFHISSIVFIPIYFLYNILMENKKRIYKYILYVFILIFVFSLDKVLLPILSKFNELEYYQKYLEAGNTNADFGFLIRNLPFIILGIYLFKKIGFNHKKFNLYYSIFIMSILLKFTSFVGAEYISRISWAYEIALVILIPYAVKLLNRRKEIYLSWFLICYVLIYWWYVYIYIGSHGTYPFQWIY